MLEDIPDDVIVVILTWFAQHALHLHILKLACLSQRFNCLCRDPLLWQYLDPFQLRNQLTIELRSKSKVTSMRAKDRAVQDALKRLFQRYAHFTRAVSLNDKLQQSWALTFQAVTCLHLYGQRSLNKFMNACGRKEAVYPNLHTVIIEGDGKASIETFCGSDFFWDVRVLKLWDCRSIDRDGMPPRARELEFQLKSIGRGPRKTISLTCEGCRLGKLTLKWWVEWPIIEHITLRRCEYNKELLLVNTDRDLLYKLGLEGEPVDLEDVCHSELWIPG